MLCGTDEEGSGMNEYTTPERFEYYRKLYKERYIYDHRPINGILELPREHEWKRLKYVVYKCDMCSQEVYLTRDDEYENGLLVWMDNVSYPSYIERCSVIRMRKALE